MLIAGKARTEAPLATALSSLEGLSPIGGTSGGSLRVSGGDIVIPKA